MKRFFSTLFLLISCGATNAATEFDCIIEPLHTLELRSPVVGLIQKIHVKRGDVVKKDQPLVTVDSGVEASAAQVAKFRSEAQGSLQVAESKLVAAQEKANRFRQLYEEQFVSAQARDDADAERKLAEAEVASAKENISLAGLEYKQSREQLNRRILTSPFPGVVGKIQLAPGALVDPSETKSPILKLTQTDVLRVESYIPLKYFNAIRQGGKVSIKPEAPLIGEYKANVTTVDSVVDAASGTFGVLIELPNNDGSIPAGVRCKINFEGVK